MGQKINAIGLRLGNRLTWRSLWSVENYNFGNLFLKDIELRYHLKLFLKSLGLDVNNLIVSGSNSRLLLSGRLVSISDFLSKEKKEVQLSTSNRRNQYRSKLKSLTHISPFMTSTQLMLSGNNQSFYDFSKSSYLKKSFYDTMGSPDGNVQQGEGFVVPISSQVLANHIAQQLSLQQKLKDTSFKRSLRKGIVSIARFVFNKKTMSYISGLKIVCSGRWQKTKSGRKQIMTYSFGKIQRQSFSKLIDYGFASTTTKYGICGVKVWISYKNS